MLHTKEDNKDYNKYALLKFHTTGYNDKLTENQYCWNHFENDFSSLNEW